MSSWIKNFWFKHWLGCVLLLAIVLFVGVIFGYWVSVPDSLKIPGDAGSFIGGISGSIFGVLTFIGLLWTIKLQRDELANSREELRLTREELSRSAEAQEDSARTAKEQQELIYKQQFETTLFSLLSKKDIIVNDLMASKGCLERIYNIIDSRREQVNWVEYHELNEYFEFLSMIVTFVERSNFEAFNKKFYLKLVFKNEPITLIFLVLCYFSNVESDTIKTNNRHLNHLKFIKGGCFYKNTGEYENIALVLDKYSMFSNLSIYNRISLNGRLFNLTENKMPSMILFFLLNSYSNVFNDNELFKVHADILCKDIMDAIINELYNESTCDFESAKTLNPDLNDEEIDEYFNLLEKKSILENEKKMFYLGMVEDKKQISEEVKEMRDKLFRTVFVKKLPEILANINFTEMFPQKNCYFSSIFHDEYLLKCINGNKELQWRVDEL